MGCVRRVCRPITPTWRHREDDGASTTGLPFLGSGRGWVLRMSRTPDPMPVRAHQRRILERLMQWKRIELDHTDAAMQAQQQEITTLHARKARLLAEVGVLGISSTRYPGQTAKCWHGRACCGTVGALWVVLGIETADKMTHRQIAVKVRRYFQDHSGR